MDSVHHPDWAQTEETLKRSMEKEIDLMREILSNMLLEESSLMQQSKSSWENLMQNRFYLIEQVKVFRQDRMNASQKLLSLSDEKNLDRFLSEGKNISCEIVYLLDQLIALSEKINSQHKRNESLSGGSMYPVGYLPLCEIPSPKNRKNFLTTIP